jgi:hypothetical protein
MVGGYKDEEHSFEGHIVEGRSMNGTDEYLNGRKLRNI